MSFYSALNQIKNEEGSLKNRHKIFIALSILVVFFTVYIMIKPALALTPEEKRANEIIQQLTEKVATGKADNILIDQGDWGDKGVKWSVLQGEDGYTLFVSGQGDLPSSAGLPWRDKYADQITRVVVARGVTANSWTKGIFKDMYSLKEAYLPDTFRSIPASMFENSGLETITIPGSAHYISEHAFKDCKNLKTVNFGDGVETIVVNAFEGTEKYTEYVLPASFKDFTYDNVYDMYDFSKLSIKSMTFKSGDLFYKDNCIYDKNGSMKYYTGSTYNKEVFRFPEEVKSCEGLVDFREYGSGKTFEVPGFTGEKWSATNIKNAICLVLENADNVKEIGDLENTQGKVKVIVGKVTALPKFNKESKIATLVVKDPGLVTSVPESAFVDCKKFDTDLSQYKNLKNIGNMGFKGDTSLSKIYLGGNLESIGNSAFEGCTGVDTLYYHVKNQPAFGTDVFKDAEFQHVVIGKEMKEISDSVLNDILSHSKTAEFLGENNFTVTKDSSKSGNYFIPEGKYYVDEKGVLYRYNDDGKTASVIFASKTQDGKVQIPAKIKAYSSTDKTISVTKVADKAFFYKSGKLSEINFEKPDQIKEISPSNWEHKDSEAKINGETENEKIAALFTAIKDKVAVEIDQSPDNKALSTNKITVEKGKARIEVVVKTTPDKTGINTFLTGENVSFTFRQDGDKLENSSAKVYLQFSSEEGAVDLSKELQGIARLEDGDLPNTKVIVFDKLVVGSTGGYDFSCKFPKNTVGGNVRIWAELNDTKEGQKETSPVKVTPYDKDKYLKVNWITEKANYKYAVSYPNMKEYNFFQGDGTGKLYNYAANFKNDISIINSDIQKNDLGNNKVQKEIVTNVISLSDNLYFNPEVIDMIKKGKYSSYLGDVYYIDSNNKKQRILNDVSRAEDIELSVVKDKNGKDAIKLTAKVKPGYNLSYRIGGYVVGIKDTSVKYTCHDGSVGVGEYTTEGTLDVVYKYGASEHLESTAYRPLPYKENSNLYLTKGRDNSKSILYWGEEVDYRISYENRGNVNEAAASGCLVDKLDQFYYMSSANMAYFFKNTQGRDAEVIINAPHISKNPKVNKAYDTSGKAITITGVETGVGTVYTNEEQTKDPNVKEGCKDDVITVKKVDDKVTIQFTHGGKVYYSPAAIPITDHLEKDINSVFTNIEYNGEKYSFKPVVDTVYTAKIYLPKEKDGNYRKVVYAGETGDFKLACTVKDTFMQLEKDWPREHPTKSREISANVIKLGNKSESDYLYRDGQKASREFTLDKSISQSGKVIDDNGVYQAEYDNVYENNIIVGHQGDGYNEVLPVVEKIEGSNLVLAPVNLNEHLKGKNLKTTKDGKYYILDKKGEYTKVNLGTRVASNISVTEENGGRTTLIKFYLSNQKGPYSRTITYKTLFEKEGNAWGSSMATTWLNDHQPFRLTAASTGTILHFVKDIVAEEGDKPENDKLVPNRFKAIDEGNEVIYRFELRNTADLPLVLDGSEFYDLLPYNNNDFKWDKSNVSLWYKVSNSNTVKPKNLDNWSIEDVKILDEQKNEKEYQRIVWKPGDKPGGTEIKYDKADSAYIYVMLKFPKGEKYNKFVQDMRDQDFFNTLYVYRMPSRVAHRAVMPGKAVLQKGVSNTYLRDNVASKENALFTYSNGNSIEYYICLYNSGVSRLYINTIEDILPRGVTLEKYQMEEYYPDKTMSGTNHVFATIDSAKYKSCTVKYSGKAIDDGKTLVQCKVSGTGLSDSISYDDILGKYYLNQGECITFAVKAEIDKSYASTEDIMANQTSMEYTDLLDKGVTVDENVGITGHHSNSYRWLNSVKQNDGTRKVINNGQAESLGFSKSKDTKERLYSSVNVERQPIKPGITKRLYSVNEKENHRGMAEFNDELVWEITLHNQSMSRLYNFNVVDEIPEEYLFDDTCRIVYKSYVGHEDEIKDAKLKKIDGKNAVMIDFTSGKAAEAAPYLVGNDVVKIYIRTKPNPDKPRASSRYINSAKLNIKDVPYDGSSVEYGEFIKGKTMNDSYILAQDQVAISSGYITNSYIEVQDQNDKDNRANSLDPKNKIHLASDKEKVVYKLHFSNSNAEKKPLKNVVLIDNFPNKGDVFPGNDDVERNSPYRIKMDPGTNNKNIKVFFIDKNGNETQVDSSKYKIGFSDKDRGFTDEDWNNKSRWNSSVSSKSNSVRIAIDSIPADTSIRVEIPGVIDAQNNNTNQFVAWNSYSYRYNLEGSKDRLDAATWKVGVGFSAVPTIEKKMVDRAGNEMTTNSKETFNFVIYKGNKIADLPLTKVESTEEFLKGKSIDYEIIPITVEAGKSSGNVKLYDSTAKDAAITKWQWSKERGKTFTVAEILPKESQYQRARLSGKYEDNQQTFTYQNDQSISVVQENTTRNWNLGLTKVKFKKPKQTLEGAVFAIYTTKAELKMSEEKMKAKANKLGVNEKDVSLTITNADSTYYLYNLDVTNSEGKLDFKDLNQNDYILKELKAPEGYIKDNDPTKIDYEANSIAGGNIDMQIYNHEIVKLPSTGGPGMIPFIVLGFGILGLSAILLARKNHRN